MHLAGFCCALSALVHQNLLFTIEHTVNVGNSYTGSFLFDFVIRTRLPRLLEEYTKYIATHCLGGTRPLLGDFRRPELPGVKARIRLKGKVSWSQ